MNRSIKRYACLCGRKFRSVKKRKQHQLKRRAQVAAAQDCLLKTGTDDFSVTVPLTCISSLKGR